MNRTALFLPLIFLSLLFFGLSLPALAQSPLPTEALLRANRLYEAGDFAAAAEAYQSLIDGGLRNSLLYYNLGNAWFKQGDLGRAILNYRRAARLAPRDPDIRANLSLARAQTADAIKADGRAPLQELVTLAQTWLTLNETALLALGLWFALAALVIVRSHLPPGRGRALLQILLPATAFLFLAALLALGSRLYDERSRPAAVVIAPEVNVTSGPGEQYITEFTLHSGAEVRLIERRDYWVRLVLPGGQLQGWVPADAVEAVAAN